MGATADFARQRPPVACRLGRDRDRVRQFCLELSNQRSEPRAGGTEIEPQQFHSATILRIFIGGKFLTARGQRGSTDPPQHGGRAMTNGSGTRAQTASPEICQGIRTNQNFQSRPRTAPFFGQRPTADFNVRVTLLPCQCEVGLYRRSHLRTPLRIFRQRRMAHAQAIERHRIRMHQVTGTPDDLPFVVDEKQMPAPLVARHVKPAVIIQLAGLDGAVFEVNLAA